MTSYDFVLNFNLPHREDDPERYLDALYEAGCRDATVGIGQFGMIGLDFTRRASDAEAALSSAVRDVQSAIPGANLVQVGPDLVGLTDVADILGCSRQNVRKYAVGKAGGRDIFPAPVILGEPSLWHLAEIAMWLRENADILVANEVFEVSKAAAELNFKIGAKRLERIRELA